jgi:16S rRNA (uracil1498-N3)-methyltransferase
VSGQNITLNAEQSHHLIRVLRQKQGAEILCFNGAGSEWLATIESATNRACVLRLTARHRQIAPPAYSLTLAVAWLKGTSMDMVVQKSTELGASAVYPLVTSRTSVKIDGKRTANKLRHWRQIAVSASEQCGRDFLPEISLPRSFDEFLRIRPPGACIMLDFTQPTLDAGTQPKSLTLMVGPEGGWSDAERELARSDGVLSASLGNLVMRAETVPLAALSAVRHGWNWQG